MRATKLLVPILLLLPALAAVAAAPAALRRFALVAGSNAGGEGTQPLRYAESDARSFAAVMQDLGGVQSKDLLLVLGPDVSRLNDAFRRMSQLVQSVGTEERRELVVYYSGHSDDNGLILGKEHLTWEALRGQINAVDADVKVAILDSCSSGSLTRAKGGVNRPAFLFDASANMEGHAFLTSSSAEEAAQESDRIRASFFTHYLVSGLRGAADTTGNGVVTLNEAYAFAYQETLASTENTQYGPQHPAYDISLTGSGDLVMTDVRSASAGLSIADEMAGRVYVRDSKGVLVVEMNKIQGQRVDLGLEPGIYTVLLDTKGSRYQADLRASTTQRTLLTQSSMRPVPIESAVARGPDAPGAGPAAPPAGQAAAPSGPADAAKELGEAIGALGNAIGKVVNQAVDAAVDAAKAATTTLSAGTSAPAPAGTAATAPAGSAAGPSTGGAAPATGTPESRAPATGEPAPAAMAQQSASSLEASAPGPLEAFHLSLIPEIYPGMFSSNTRRVISLNLLIGASGSIMGTELGGLANIESHDVSGFQAAGLSNIVLGDMRGVQTAGLFNYIGGTISIFQAAGLVNMSRGLDGVQAAGMINMDLGNARGAELSGLVNLSAGDFSGAQLAGIANVTLKAARGAQVSGIVNWAGGGMQGAQVAGIWNWTPSIRGPQISLVNISRDVQGAQVGLVNIAGTVSGAQVGLVNVSRVMHGIPVGLISVVLEGRYTADYWVDLDGYQSVNLAFGANSLYTVVTGGYLPGTDPALWSFGLGFGTRIPLGPFFLDADLVALHGMSGFDDWRSFGNFAVGAVYPRARLAFGVPLFGILSVEVGAVVRVDAVLLYNELASGTLTSAPFTPNVFFGVQL